jgi:hypothetical protein
MEDKNDIGMNNSNENEIHEEDAEKSQNSDAEKEREEWSESLKAYGYPSNWFK